MQDPHSPATSTNALRAVVYVRISKDRTGAGLGVERQESDCRALAAQLGYDVAAVYADNDISAYSGKHRPGYEQMLSELSAGQYDAVIVWHQDRLLRRTVDLETYIPVVEPKNVPTYTVKAGTLDLATPAGRAIARTLAAWAAYEVETSTARVKAAKLQAAKAGKWSGGGRAYGYEPGMTAIREKEAKVVRELVDRVIKGESFRQLAIDLNRRGIPTALGARWTALGVRNLLLHKRYAGFREHLGESYPAEWPAIVTLKTWTKLQAAIEQRRQSSNHHGPARKYLLTGFAYCGTCGNRMNTNTTTGRKSGSRYVCKRNPLVDGREAACGRMVRVCAAVDLLVAECIIYRLSSTRFAHELQAVEQAGPELSDLLAKHTLTKSRLDTAAEKYMDGSIDDAEYERLKTAATDRLAALDRQIASATPKRLAVDLPIGELARERWNTADLRTQRDIVAALIKRVVINPSDTKGMKKAEYFEGYRFRPEDVQIEWLA